MVIFFLRPSILLIFYNVLVSLISKLPPPHRKLLTSSLHWTTLLCLILHAIGKSLAPLYISRSLSQTLLILCKWLVSLSLRLHPFIGLLFFTFCVIFKVPCLRLFYSPIVAFFSLLLTLIPTRLVALSLVDLRLDFVYFLGTPLSLGRARSNPLSLNPLLRLNIALLLTQPLTLSSFIG